MPVLSGGPDNMPEDLYDGSGAWAVTIGNWWSDWMVFTQRTKLIIVTARDAGVRFAVSEDGVVPTQEIWVFGDTSLAITLQGRYWRAMNLVVDEVCRIVVDSFHQKP